ncbi:thioredoxin family protein [Parapedobacter sp. DT-150]|uniref:thioredoxin family protein n=1 Tax=Parapedobacter sp. DT-150 TaxID=3396162 RepID=UPI003F1D49F4
MDFPAYLLEFERIVDDPAPLAPYNNPAYMEYTRLNWSRMNRWLKKGELTELLTKLVKDISQPQQWTVITEPWCGDAAHSVPFIQLGAQLNPMITVDYELRDSPPFHIESYLTAGSRSIPKLIIRDTHGTDLATWGPRPTGCQLLYDRLKTEGADFETQKIALQKWYNEDRGLSVQAELAALLTSSTQSPGAAHPGIPLP